MSTDASIADQPATCPSCGATVRQSVPWCLQCYASLRPQPEPEPDPDPEPEPNGEPGDVETPDEEAQPTSSADVAAIADRMLAELRASEPRPSGWLARAPSGRGGRAVVVAACIAVLALALVLVLTLLGHLL